MTISKRQGTEDAVRTLLPFLESSVGEPLEKRLETAPLEILRGFYLFSVSGLVVPQDEEDLPHFVERRFMSVLSAAHRAGWTVLTAAVGTPGGVIIHLGFMTDSSTGASPYVFERILRGLLPGLGVNFIETATIESFLVGKSYGAIVAGVPILKIDDERQRFSLPAVIRSMHGESYALLLVSRPLDSQNVAKQLQQVWKVRDECHILGRRTRTKEEGGGDNWHRDEGLNESTSLSKSESGSWTKGASAIIINASHTSNTSTTDQSSKGTSVTSGQGGEKHWSESLSTEEENSVALELERLAERHAGRLMKAANVGQWETAITFATGTQAGRDILAGVLLGELAKPSTDVFPPRVYYKDLDARCPLLLPGLDDLSAVFPRSLASYLTGEELASIASPPVENLPGYDIRRIPPLSLTDPTLAASDGQVLGTVCDHGQALEGVHVGLGPVDLAKHLFVCGLTGTGKTTTVKALLAKSRVPFLVLESAKRDYRQLLGVDGLREQLKVYTVGDSTVSPLNMNPFYVMPDVSVLVHIDFLKAIFNASFSLYGPMPYILEKCIHNVYVKRGWDLITGRHLRLCGPNGEVDRGRYKSIEAEHFFPTLVDLKDEVHEYVRSTLEYRGELSDNIRTAIVTRIESLSVGAKGQLFGTSKPFDVEAFLKVPTVLELEALSDDDDKAFFVGMMLTFISEYRQTRNPALDPFAANRGTLQHLLVIEEAHRLLKNVAQERQSEQVGNPRGKAVEFFANIISEMRAMGQGVVVVEQIPSKILPDVIKNTNAKIVHRLVAGDDQALIASSIGLSPAEAICLTSLTTGHALYLKEGMQRPVEVAVASTVPSTRVSHERVKKAMQTNGSSIALDEAMICDMRGVLGREGDALALRTLCTIAANKDLPASAVAREALHTASAAVLKKDRCVVPSITTKYLADRIVRLLAYGEFRLHGNDLWEVTDVVRSVLVGDDDAATDLRQRLARGWRKGDAVDGLVQILRGMVFERALKAQIKSGNASTSGNASSVDRIVRSYFLIDVPAIRQSVVTQVVAGLWGQPWSH